MLFEFHLDYIGYWFTPRNNLFLQLWKLTAIFNQIWLKNVVKHQFTIKGWYWLFPCKMLGTNHYPEL